MARVFISHSSRDGDLAARMKVWLQAQGFETPFLDFDKHAGIPPGASWERTLYNEIQQSEAVVLIQTPNWLDSKWCFAEFTQARALGKPIFPVIETSTDGALISADIQVLDLRKDRAEGLEQLYSQLTRIALDAQGGFGWDATRPPYPGLLAFQEEDAALYFGRDDDIRRLIERLNARRVQGGAKLVALLGASGSGKSSLLRAGVIPRLKRDHRNWIVVPPLRPQVRPVDELLGALEVACGPSAGWAKLSAQLQGGDPAPALREIAHHLRSKAGANEAQILLPVDQAEELFGASDPLQAKRFFELLTHSLASDLPFLAVLAMRSDYLGRLQSFDHLQVRFEEFSLGPMPLARIEQIIHGPARVAGLRLEEAFVQQAVHDAETEDALPLLAFALRELYDRSAGDNYLSLEEYLALGNAKEGLTPLENSVRKAADGVLSNPQPSAGEVTALREAFVPAMVRVNDQGEYVRQPARWDDLPPKAYPLLERLAKARLLIIRQDGVCMVEVAHEALLRKWPLLRSWLDEAREFLVGKQQLEQDLHDWESAAEPDKASVLLTGLKLNRIRGWLAERPQQLTPQERAFGLASIQQAESENRRKARLRRNITRGFMAAAVVLAFATVVAGRQWFQAKQAKDNLAREVIRYAWIDLAGRQKEVKRLTALAEKFSKQPGDFLPNVVTQADGFDCRTYLDGGFRYLYCSVRSVLSFPKLQAIAGVNVFRPGGPHAQELNLQDPNQFGHYNPDFLTWMERFAIPQGLKDSRSGALLQLVYQTHIGPTVRALYHSHEILFAQPDTYSAFEKRYQVVKKTYLAKLVKGETNDSRFQDGTTTNPVPFEKIKDAYLKRLNSHTNTGSEQEEFRWLSDYLATDLDDDWYLSNTAGGFWVRRSIDGTEPQVFRLVKKELQAFEPMVMGAP